MTAPEGGFYSAEDADSLPPGGAAEKREGAFYVWTQAEIESLLGEDAALFCQIYGVEERGNAPAGSDPHEEFTGLNILIRRGSPEAAAELEGHAGRRCSPIAPGGPGLISTIKSWLPGMGS